LTNIPSNTASTSARPSGEVTPVMPAQVATPTNSLTSEQSLIAAELDIRQSMLRTGAPLSLQANYMRYLEYLETCQKLATIKNAGTWPPGLKKPTSMDIILLFIGKTAWYDSWSKSFPAVAKYPEMVNWLKSEDGRQSDLEIWGCVQGAYHFTDLIKWLENGGTLVEKKEKKEKGKGKGKGKGREKEKVSHKSGSSKAGRK
jgi:hypothetical protein